MKTYVTTSLFGIYKEVTTDKTEVSEGNITETYEVTKYIFGIPFSSFTKTEFRRMGLKDAVINIFNGSNKEED
mgnify:FL=1